MCDEIGNKFYLQTLQTTMHSYSPTPTTIMDTPSTQQILARNLCAVQQLAQRKSNQHNKLVIFDWDDTLYPTTTYFFEQRFKNISVERLNKFGQFLYKLLATYIKTFGSKNVFIVTNGLKQWVSVSLQVLSTIYVSKSNDNKHLSSLNYFATIYNLLIALNISIISAKELYAKCYPKQPTVWKTLVFKQIVMKHFNLDGFWYNNNNNNTYSIISIGDSNDEYMASEEAKNMLKKRYFISDENISLYRIKLHAKPTINYMLNEFAFLIEICDSLNEREKCGSITIDYEVELQKHQNPK